MNFYSFAKGLVKIVFKIFFKIEVNGLEYIPSNTRAIICSNHISVLDPVMVGITMPRRIYFMAKKELFDKKLLGLIINKLGAFPVDRNANDLGSIRKAIKILREENILGMFPEGTRVKEQDINSAKPGVSMISIKAKSPIIPIYIDTEYKLFKSVKITVGKPIEFKEFYNKKLKIDDYKMLSQKVMSDIYSLADTRRS